MRRIAVRMALMAGVIAAFLPSEPWANGAAHSREPIAPIAAPSGLDANKVALGRALFSDPILSSDGTVSCASCHNLAAGGVDRRPHSVGVGGAEGSVNAPTVYNSGLNYRQFWDGRADTLESQVDGPITNPIEMNGTWAGVLARLKASSYRPRFQALYGGEVSASAVRDALSSFERSLATVDSRFDHWLRGDDGALSATERRGYELFKSYGCASCHQGANVGGNMFQRFGFFGSPFTGTQGKADLGRFNVTGREEDRHVFKVPSLRLAVLTPPYFHDGSVPDLPQAIQMMGRYQLGRDIPPGDIDLIIAFLETLPGKMDTVAAAGSGR